MTISARALPLRKSWVPPDTNPFIADYGTQRLVATLPSSNSRPLAAPAVVFFFGGGEGDTGKIDDTYGKKRQG